MTKNQKQLVVSLAGAIGLIIMLIPIFTQTYSFGLGLIIAIAIWVISAVVAKYWGVKKEE